MVAASPNYAYWICSGMESGLHALLLAASVWALVRDFRLRHGLTSGIVLALLALTRPEAPLQILAAAALWLGWLRTERRWPGRPEAMLLGPIVILCGGYLAFRWGYFARLLPNTYYAKLRWDFRPEDYLLGFVRAYPLPLALSGVLGVLGLVVRSSRRPASLALAFLACNVIFVWVVKGDWMAEWRFLSPFWPLLGILVSAGLCALAVLWSSRQSPGPGAYRWLPAATGLVVLALAVPAQLARFDGAKRNPGFPATFVRANAPRLRRGLQSLGIQQARLGLPDIGGLGLALRGDQILDVAGLADYALAQQGGNFPAMEDYLVSEGLPDVVDAHGPSGHVGSFARLMSHYQPVGGGIWLLKGLEPGRDPRCPGGQVSAALSMDVTTIKNHLDALIEAGDPEDAVNLVRCVQAHRPAALAELWPVAINAALAADRAEQSGALQRALRLLSLATILSNENAHLRRRTEQIRSRLFPRPAESRAR